MTQAPPRLDVREEPSSLVPYRGASGLAIGAELAELTDDDFRSRLEALKKQQERIRLIQQTVMTKNSDYGDVPGTERPTLLKGGAEKLCNLYGLVARTEVTVSEGDGILTPPISVDTICYLHRGNFDGPVVGKGQANANSWEKKYRWLTMRHGLVCPDCGREGVIMTKRHVWWHPSDAKPDGGCGANFTSDDERLKGQTARTERVEDPDPWDKRNTLIKMSEKRAHVDATLRATATSGLFTQDVEDDDAAAQRAVEEAPPEGSAPWLSGLIRQYRVTQAIVAAVVDQLGLKGVSLTAMTDDQRRTIWKAIVAADEDSPDLPPV